MGKFTYLDFIRAMQNNDTIQLIGEIDINLLKSNKVESLNYSFPLIERMILEIYKLVPESDVEHYEQGIMKTPISIIDNNVEVLPANTVNIIKRIYGDDGIRNKLFHVKSEIINIEVSFEEVNVGIPLNTVSISSSVKSFTLPVNRHSVSLIASCSSSSPCKNLTTSLASAFWASLFSGSVFTFSSKSFISSCDRKVNTFRYSTTFESSVFTRY